MTDPSTALQREINSFLPVASDLARRAGDLLMVLRQSPLTESRKSDHSLVTNADHASNDLIRAGLKKEFPNHAIVSEETGLEGNPSRFTWLVDPLDGTRSYAKGKSGFCVMVGLLLDESPVLGVVFDPLEGYLYEAVRGSGCFCTFHGERRELRVSRRADWPSMPLVTSTGVPDSLKKYLENSLSTPFVEPINSVGVKAGYVARQAADIYVNHHTVHEWDTCAPLVLLEEAGGTMTHWDGSPLRYSVSGDHRHPGPTVASNTWRHQELVMLLTRVTKP